ncbi:hypothetical protein ACFE04_009601 [Oxalis oulophora]
MAGMLPGVECARRRRFHQSRGGAPSESPSVAAAHGWTRRSSFCLYTSNHDSHHNSISSHQRISILSQTCLDEKLGGIAREAKERLDEKLRTHRKSHDSKRHNKNKEEIKLSAGRSRLQEEPVSIKRNGSKRFNWSKFSWRSSDQDECAVCLDQFKIDDGGATVIELPCAHKFHGRCLVPWLENNSHCPCCRMEIST